MSKIWSSTGVRGSQIQPPNTQDGNQERKISPAHPNTTGISLLCIYFSFCLYRTILTVGDHTSVSPPGSQAPSVQGLCLAYPFIPSTRHSTWNITGTWYIFPELNPIPQHYSIPLSKCTLRGNSGIATQLQPPTVWYHSCLIIPLGCLKKVIESKLHALSWSWILPFVKSKS